MLSVNSKTLPTLLNVKNAANKTKYHLHEALWNIAALPLIMATLLILLLST